MNYLPPKNFDPATVRHEADPLRSRQKIAVIGSGIAGNTAAWLLDRHHDVTLFEAQDRLGGHSNTVDVPVAEGMVPVDTGFIVYNEVNYPHFVHLLRHLGVQTSPSDMSFSVSLGGGRLEYIGAGLRGMLAQKRNWFNPGHWRLITDLVRFYKTAPSLKTSPVITDKSLGQMMRDLGYSRSFIKNHILPMAAAIWSTPTTDILDFPAKSFLDFFDNHGLFRLSDRPIWRTIAGGSRHYVHALTSGLTGQIHLNAPVQSVRRADDGVWVCAKGRQPERFDQVVLASHGDDALALLETPSAQERSVLSGFAYSLNRAYLHKDPGLMPRLKRCWASWNYLSQKEGNGEQLLLSYWMNKLQPLATQEDIFVTLNPAQEPAHTIAQFDYTHPMFNQTSLGSQKRMNSIQGVDRIWYCGAHLGYGFHEDGVASAVRVAAMLGVEAPWLSELPAETAYQRLAA